MLAECDTYSFHSRNKTLKKTLNFMCNIYDIIWPNHNARDNGYKCLFRQAKIKDAMPVSFRSELFSPYILTIFEQWNLLP